MQNYFVGPMQTDSVGRGPPVDILFATAGDSGERGQDIHRVPATLAALLLPTLCVLFLPLIPTTARAGEVRYDIEITPFFGYRLGGEFEADEDVATAAEDIDIDIDDASSFGLIVNWPAEENTEWEVYLSRQSTSLETDELFATGETPPTDLDISYVQLGGTYYFDGPRAQPYIVATVGASRFEPDDSSFDSETFFAFGIGGGYKIAPTSRVGVRVEARVFGSVVDADEAVFCRSGPEASGCLIAVSGSVVWQWEVLAGLTFRL